MMLFYKNPVDYICTSLPVSQETNYMMLGTFFLSNSFIHSLSFPQLPFLSKSKSKYFM